eukprot:scaffold546_cov352-Prasinococcus_capsulatus_cf.AAC.20
MTLGAGCARRLLACRRSAVAVTMMSSAWAPAPLCAVRGLPSDSTAPRPPASFATAPPAHSLPKPALLGRCRRHKPPHHSPPGRGRLAVAGAGGGGTDEGAKQGRSFSSGAQGLNKPTPRAGSSMDGSGSSIGNGSNGSGGGSNGNVGFSNTRTRATLGASELSLHDEEHEDALGDEAQVVQLQVGSVAPHAANAGARTAAAGHGALACKRGRGGGAAADGGHLPGQLPPRAVPHRLPAVRRWLVEGSLPGGECAGALCDAGCWPLTSAPLPLSLWP